MYVEISLCNEDVSENEFNFKLSEENFFELWQDYLNLTFDRRVFSPKEVINAIDSKLDPDYNTNDNNSKYLGIVKKLEDICIMALVNQDTICLKVVK